MNTHLSRFTLAATLMTSLSLAPTSVRASSDASFDRNLNVSGPVRVEVSNGSGDVQIKLAANGTVHIHGDVRTSWSIFGNDQKLAQELAANPPVEQRGDTIRIDRGGSRTGDFSISYVIEVPQDTEVSVNLASGSLTVTGIRGPLKAESASGSIHIEKIERDANVSTASGAITASDLGGYLRASTSSGSTTVSNVKEDVRVDTSSGSIHVTNPGARIEAQSRSGSIEIYGASADTQAQSLSGHVTVYGDPGKSGYWNLESRSGSINLGVRSNSAFFFSAESSSGGIHTDIPIVIEEQGKHSLRARVGNGGARVKVHTASGSINVRAAS
ncbi:MAG: hypothetical protein PVS2B2_13980 [Candidatus Acidiferrum sp.]